MLRALVVLLLLANALFFAWTGGWLAPVLPAPQHGQREPARLAAQVRPEQIVVMTPQAASAAVAAVTATTCLEAGPFSDADIASAEAALAAAVPAGTWARRELQLPGSWLVYMGRFATEAALRARSDELRRAQLPFTELGAPPELAPGLVLSRHDSEGAAEAALASTTQRGVRGLRVVALPPPPLQHYLRVASANAALQAQLASLKPPVMTASFAPCKTPA